MTNVFAVVGEHRAEPCWLLLLGDDGRYYAYTDRGVSAAEPTDEWMIDPDTEAAA